MKLITRTPKETVQFARKFAKTIRAGSVIALDGDLGAGKTTFIKGLALGLGIKNQEEVKSPTFVILHVYETKIPIYHFDLYRLDEEKDFRAIGLDEFVYDPNVIVCVEWAHKAKSWLPPSTHQVRIEIKGKNARQITINSLETSRSGHGSRSNAKSN